MSIDIPTKDIDAEFYYDTHGQLRCESPDNSKDEIRVYLNKLLDDCLMNNEGFSE